MARPQRFQIECGECEHEGDAEAYADDMTRCGARVTLRWVYPDVERCVIEGEVADYSRFSECLRRTRQAGVFCNSGGPLGGLPRRRKR